MDFFEIAPTRRGPGYIDPALSASILKTGPVHIVNPRCFRKLMNLSLRKCIGLVCGHSLFLRYLLMKNIFLVENLVKTARFRQLFGQFGNLKSLKVLENERKSQFLSQ